MMRFALTATQRFGLRVTIYDDARCFCVTLLAGFEAMLIRKKEKKKTQLVSCLARSSSHRQTADVAVSLTSDFGLHHHRGLFRHRLVSGLGLPTTGKLLTLLFPNFRFCSSSSPGPFPTLALCSLGPCH